MKTSNKKTVLKLLAVLLVLLTALAPAAAFAEGDDAPVLLSSGDGAPAASSDGGDGATYTIPEDAEDGKMYILGNPDTSTSDPVLTTGTETPEGQSDSQDATSGLSEEELARRKEIYTMVTLIAMAAIIVGLREKRNRR